MMGILLRSTETWNVDVLVNIVTIERPVIWVLHHVTSSNVFVRCVEWICTVMPGRRRARSFSGRKLRGEIRLWLRVECFFTSPLTYEYVHVDTCKVFTSRHENVEDAVAEWLKMAVPQLPALPAAPMVSTKGTSLDTGPVVDEAVDFKERLAQDMKQLRKDIRQIYD